MKIGMLLDTTYPPDSRIDNEASFLIAQKHEVHLFNLNYKNLLSREEIRQIKVYRYAASMLTYKLSALAYDWPFYHQLIKNKIAAFIEESGVEVLHVHDMLIAKAVIEVNKKYKLPLVLDLHEDRPEIMKYYRHVKAFPGKYLINLKRWAQAQDELIKNVDRVVVVTDYAKAAIAERNVKSAAHIHVVPNIVNPEIFLSYAIDENILQSMQGSFNVLYVGDTATRRGTDTAIKSIALLKDKIPHIKLWIVGKSTEDEQLKALASALSLTQQVVFAGWQDVSLFPSYIKGADVCISPLKRNKHHDTTYANKIFQYMALGKPLVVSDCTAQAAVVEQAACGLIHKADDVASLADGILKLYKEPDLAQQMGNAGKQSLLNQFDYVKSLRELASLYQELAERRKTI